MTWPARIYLFVFRNFDRMCRFLGAVLSGVGLGLLRRKDVGAVDAAFYSRAGSAYLSASHNTQGLYAYERQALDSRMREARRILVIGAGGGREVIALRALGLDADGYESNPDLVAFGKDLMPTPEALRLVDRDAFPEVAEPYDAVWLGWGLYSYIQGRETRVALLRRARAALVPGGLLFATFHTRPALRWHHRVTAGVANVFRLLTLRERVQPGDTLHLIFAHEFDADEVRDEFAAAGFELLHYSRELYGNATGRSLPSGGQS